MPGGSSSASGCVDIVSVVRINESPLQSRSWTAAVIGFCVSLAGVIAQMRRLLLVTPTRSSVGSSTDSTQPARAGRADTKTVAPRRLHAHPYLSCRSKYIQISTVICVDSECSIRNSESALSSEEPA